MLGIYFYSVMVKLCSDVIFGFSLKKILLYFLSVFKIKRCRNDSVEMNFCFDCYLCKIFNEDVYWRREFRVILKDLGKVFLKTESFLSEI